MTGRYKEKQYQEAVALRRRGFTYREIAKISGVSVGTVSSWLAREPFSRAVASENRARAIKENEKRLRLINKARQSERALHHRATIKLARTEYRHYRTSPLFVAGLVLYASAGDTKNERLIRLSDSRPDLHRTFMLFLKEFMGIERKNIRFWLLLYPDLDEVSCMKYWIKYAGFSASQFYKNQYIKGRSQKRTLHFGVGNTIIGNTLLKKKLTFWIEQMFKEFKKSK